MREFSDNSFYESMTHSVCIFTVCLSFCYRDYNMAEYCEFNWTRRDCDSSIVTPTKTISLIGIQDNTPVIKAVRDLIPTRPDIG